MPLLLCPNDNVAMQTVNRAGVEFDICPQCRGVWLDRGELEKIIGAAGEGGSEPSRQRHSHAPYPADRYERERRWDDDDYRKRKRKGFDIFDIFD